MTSSSVTTEDEMVGWRHQLDGDESEQAPGVGDGQGGLAWCSPWGCKESDTTEQLNRTELGEAGDTDESDLGPALQGLPGWWEPRYPGQHVL